MAIIVKKAAVGDAPATGMMKTPPPVRPPAPDEVSEIRHPSLQTHGMNGPNNPSSVPPGVGGPLSALGKNLKASVDDDGLLDRIAQRGVGKGVIADVDLQSPQTRDVSKEQYPSVHGQTRRQSDEGSPGGTVPSACGAPVTDDWAARRAERLKG